MSPDGPASWYGCRRTSPCVGRCLPPLLPLWLPGNLFAWLINLVRSGGRISASNTVALELIVGNYYVLTLLVFIAATACALVLARRLTPERAAPGLLTRLPPSSSGRGTQQRGMRFRRTTQSS